MELSYIERSVVIRNRGSIEFSQEEQSADIVLVDIKCEAIGGTVYYNSKTLPPYGFYGSVTLFGGATVRERLPLEFIYQRVIDFESIYRRLRCYLTRISIRQEAKEGASPNNYFTPLGDAILPDSFEYRGLPYSKLKLNSERLAQYTVTVRSYTESTGFACQAQSKPDDPTKGEPEYPNPLPIPNSGDFPPQLPEPTTPYNGADPNDFDPNGDGGTFPRQVWFRISGFYSTAVNQPNCLADAPFSEIFTWIFAGPPAYSVEIGFAPGSPCTNYGHGLRIVSKSEDYAPQGTVASAEIVDFRYYSFQ